MPRRAGRPTAAIRFDVVDRAEAISAITTVAAQLGGRIRTLATVRHIPGDPELVEIELEVEGLDEDALAASLEGLELVRAVHRTKALGTIFGKRIIVVGGGAQVAQVALGAVSEADRHNLRGERISVDTIPLVGEANIAAAVRAVADLPRARLLVLAGSIMGGDISVGGRGAARGRHPDHRAEHGRLDHRRTSTSSSRIRSRPARWRSWRSPTRPPSTSRASAAGATGAADADRDLERQLAQGPPGRRRDAGWSGPPRTSCSSRRRSSPTRTPR